MPGPTGSAGPTGPTGLVALAQSAVLVTAAADTTLQTLATITVPANALGVNGRLRLTALWTFAGAGNRTVRVVFGGTQVFARVDANSAATRIQVDIANRGAANSQLAHSFGMVSTGAALGPGAVGAAVDTTAAQDITITGQKATAGDTLILQGYSVEVFPA